MLRFTENQQLRMRQLLSVINNQYNEIIGGAENACMDGNEFHPWTPEELIEDITDTITTQEYLQIEDSWELVEAKHFRFLSKDNIRAMVAGRVMARHEEDHGWLWEKRKVRA